MKKQFLTAYKAIYNCSMWKAWKAWRTLPEGLKIAVIESM